MSKVMGICVKFTKTTHQIWSFHVILASNSEKFSFSPNSVSNFRKSYLIWGKLAQEEKSYRQKTNFGVGTPLPSPSAYRVKIYQFEVYKCIGNHVQKQNFTIIFVL